MPKKCTIYTRIFIMGWILTGSVFSLYAGEGTDIIKLGTMVNIYEPVHFEHGMHEEMASCATCHHHTLGMPTEDEKCLRCHWGSGETDEIMCSGCHAKLPGDAVKFDIGREEGRYHIDVTGLKRAYHLKCMGCHVDLEAASGCEDCHSRREAKIQ